jgi:LTXXQ motif family protein
MHRWVAPALLAVAIPTLALAQQAQAPAPAQPQPPAKSDRERPRLSPEARAKLVDGRMAMIKETLKLNDAQLKLWQPVEAQMRARSAAREQRWAERRQAREQGLRRRLPPVLCIAERRAEGALQHRPARGSRSRRPRSSPPLGQPLT